MNFELLKARKQAGLTQQKVANAANMKRDRYYRIELGKIRPTVDEAFEIAKAVNKEVEKIFLSDNAHNSRKNSEMSTDPKDTDLKESA